MLIHVKIHPGASKADIAKISDLSYDVHVREKAEKNAANKAMIGLLAAYFKKAQNEFRIITGHHSSSKIIEIFEKNDKGSK